MLQLSMYVRKARLKSDQTECLLLKLCVYQAKILKNNCGHVQVQFRDLFDFATFPLSDSQLQYKFVGFRDTLRGLNSRFS